MVGHAAYLAPFVANTGKSSKLPSTNISRCIVDASGDVWLVATLPTLSRPRGGHWGQGTGCQTIGGGPQMVQLEIAPADDYFGTGDPRWKDELSDLDRELRRAAPNALQSPDPAQDDKGFADVFQVVMDLGSSGVLTAAVGAMSAWLGRRPKQRRLIVKWTNGADGGTVEIDGTNVSDEAIAAALGRVDEELKRRG